MELIKQCNEHDCGVAALAMVLGAEMEDVEAALNHEADQVIEETGAAMGVTDMEMVVVLFEFDARPVLLYTEETLTQHLPEEAHADMVTGRYLYDTERVKEVLPDKVAILVVESQNQRDRHHYIVWDRDRILDPANQNVYRHINEIRTIHAAILLD